MEFRVGIQSWRRVLFDPCSSPAIPLCGNRHRIPRFHLLLAEASLSPLCRRILHSSQVDPTSTTSTLSRSASPSSMPAVTSPTSAPMVPSVMRGSSTFGTLTCVVIAMHRRYFGSYSKHDPIAEVVKEHRSTFCLKDTTRTLKVKSVRYRYSEHQQYGLGHFSSGSTASSSSSSFLYFFDGRKL